MDARAILESRYSSDRLAVQATRDSLTDVWNRRSFTLALDRVLADDAVALIDLDHFKQVNDGFGHQAGDEVLVAFARFMSDAVPMDCVIGRLGGEEFGIILPGTSVEAALALVGRLQADWAQVAPRSVTFSAGVTQVGPAERPRIGRDALHRADELMYEAKLAGRNRVAC
jgi:diguanylate cyclase (GGDEF)-like protein